MATAIDWIEQDVGDVAVALAGLEPSPAIAGWAGIYRAHEAPEPRPTPSGLATAPTVFAVWLLALDQVPVATFDADAAPTRRHEVRCSIYVERGAGDHADVVLQVQRNIRQALAAASGVNGLLFDHATARMEYFGEDGEWVVHLLRVTALGG